MFLLVLAALLSRRVSNLLSCFVEGLCVGVVLVVVSISFLGGRDINILLFKNGLELLYKLIKGIGVVDHLVIFDMVLVILGYDSSCIFLISILLGMLSELGQTLFLVLLG